MEDLSGQTLGSYKLLDKIGAGGMATVYRAYQATMDRYVAVKVLPREFAEDPMFVGRFQQEARTIAKLEHRHILPVYDYGEDRGITYLVMRYVDAGTLTDLIKLGSLDLKAAIRVTIQVAEALDYAHKNGVTHRDIKPSNVLVDEQGDTYLTDFGIAKLAESVNRFTGTGQLLGTPAYMSPEQGQGIPADYRSDIYSLGVVLYELVTGRLPFEAETPVAVLLMHVNDPLPPPRRANPKLPGVVERIILKATVKDPAERYQSAGEMAAALRDALAHADVETPAGVLADEPTEVEPETARPAPREPESYETAAVSRRRGLSLPVILGALAGLAVLVIAVILIAGSGGLSDEDATATADAGTQAAVAALDLAQQQTLEAATSEAGTLTAEAPTATPTPTPTATVTPEPTRPAFSFEAPAEWEHFTYTGDTRALLGHDGYMWAASDGGLVRWSPDGSYIKYTTAEGLPFSRLRALIFDEGGGLWLGGGYYAGLARITFGEDGSIAAVEDFSDIGGDSHDVWSFLQTDDALYMAEYGPRISAWDGETWMPAIPSPPEALGEYLYTMVEVDGEIWAGMEEGLAIWDGASWREANLPGVEMGTEVSVICQDGDGVVWVGAEENLVRYLPDTGTWENMDDWWGGDYEINSALLTSDGTFWLASDGYITRRAPGEDSWQVMEEDTPGWVRHAMAEDEEGNIWLVISGAVGVYDGSRWQTFSVPNEPAGNELTHVVLTDSGQLWFAVEYGEQVISYDPETGEWSTVIEVGSTIQDIALDEDGVVWLGTWDGLVRIEGAAQRRFSMQDGLVSDDVEMVLVDPKNPSVIWAGTEDGVSRFDYAAGEWMTFDMEATGLSSNEAAVLFADFDGRVWLASAGEFSWDDDVKSALAGLAVYDDENESWTVIGKGDAPFGQYTTSVYDIANDQDGNVWVAGRVSNLYRWDGEQWRVFTGADGAPEESVLAMLLMPDDSMWFASEDASFFRFDPQRGWSRIPPRDLGWSANTYDMLLSPDGVLWLLTEEGVISFRP